VTNKRATRQEVFAREYVIDLNATRAAISAGYSESTAEAQASRLLRKSKVKALLAELTKARFERLDISAVWLLGELRKIAVMTPVPSLATMANEGISNGELSINCLAIVKVFGIESRACSFQCSGNYQRVIDVVAVLLRNFECRFVHFNGDG
jgi:hypothetical protein